MPHAEVRVDRLAAAQALRGVQASSALVEPGRSVARGVVRYVGQPVAAVAATLDGRSARRRSSLIRVDYQPLPFVVDLDEALKAGRADGLRRRHAPPGSRPGARRRRVCRSRATCAGPRSRAAATSSAGFAAADVIVEGEYRTQVQTHCCLEPHGLVADWRDDGLTVHISTQFTAGVRHELAQAFDLPLEKVRVVVDGMGGGFGSKSTLGNYGRIAVALSRQAGAPVR